MKGLILFILSRTLSSGIWTLQGLVNIAGVYLSRADNLTATMGLRSLRVVNQLLHSWRTSLTSEERVQLRDYQYTDWSYRKGTLSPSEPRF